MSKRFQKLLRDPPLRQVKCGRCDGMGIINLRGMILSDDCPRCHGDGKKLVIDYIELERKLRKTI